MQPPQGRGVDNAICAIYGLMIRYFYENERRREYPRELGGTAKTQARGDQERYYIESAYHLAR